MRAVDVRVGTWIVCPTSGLPERVTMTGPSVKGQRFIRTTRHDHRRPEDFEFEVVDPPS